MRRKWDEIRSRARKGRKEDRKREKKRNDDVVNEEGEDSFLLIFKSIERIIRGEEKEDILSYRKREEKEEKKGRKKGEKRRERKSKGMEK